MPSLVRVAHDAGYATVAIHGTAGDFWNRAKAFKTIGFDRFVTSADFPDEAAREGWYFADSAMTDQIIDKLRNANRRWYSPFSIEAHGPYINVPVGNTQPKDAIPAPKGLSDKSAREYRNYMYHIEHADRPETLVQRTPAGDADTGKWIADGSTLELTDHKGRLLAPRTMETTPCKPLKYAAG